MTARGVLLLMTIVLGCSQGKQSSLENTRLKTHPTVTGGSAIEPGSVILTLNADGRLFIDGKRATLDDVSALRRSEKLVPDLDPVLLEIHPDLTFEKCATLIEAVIGKARRGNVAFLARSPSGLCAIPLPVIHALAHLKVTLGRTVYDEGEWSSERQRHLWLSLRTDGGGRIRVESITRKRFDEIRFPEPGSVPAPDPTLWKGEHPTLGPWSFDQLRQFLSEPRIRDLTPFGDLKVGFEDRMGDLMQCLDSLREATDVKVLVSFPAH